MPTKEKKKQSLIKNTCIIRSDATIKLMLQEQIKKHDIRYNDLIANAERQGIIVSKAQISRYFTSDDEINGLPTQEAILSMCKFLKISVKVRAEYVEK